MTTGAWPGWVLTFLEDFKTLLSNTVPEERLNDTATRDATINLMQFERWGLVFHSIGIFENQEEVNRKVLARFSDIFEKQFSSLTVSDRITTYIKSQL